MKKVTLCFLVSLCLACTKENENINPTPDQPEVNTSLLSAIAPDYNVDNPTEKDVLSVLHFLDTASATNKRNLYVELNNDKKIKTAQKREKTNARMDATADEYSAAEMASSMQPIANQDYDPQAWIDDVYHPGHMEVLYNWTALESPIAPFLVISTERLDVADNGPTEPVASKYFIIDLQHTTSFITGYAPGITWTEAGASTYHASFTGYIHIQGTLSCLGLNFYRSSDRYFNSGYVITYNGLISQ